MKQLTQILSRLPEYRELCAKLDGGRSPVEVSGLSGVHRAHMAAALSADLEAPVVGAAQGGCKAGIYTAPCGKARRGEDNIRPRCAY